jgi:hypothetical protein
MDKQKHVYESEVMGLPPLRLVLGDIPSPDPELRTKSGQPLRTSTCGTCARVPAVLAQAGKPGHEIEGTVKRIIAHLEED